MSVLFPWSDILLVLNVVPTTWQMHNNLLNEWINEEYVNSISTNVRAHKRNIKGKKQTDAPPHFVLLRKHGPNIKNACQIYKTCYTQFPLKKWHSSFLDCIYFSTLCILTWILKSLDINYLISGIMFRF